MLNTGQSNICIVNTNNGDQTENSRRQCDPYYHNNSWYKLKQLRMTNAKNLIIGCQDKNSLRRKYMHMSDVFQITYWMFLLFVRASLMQTSLMLILNQMDTQYTDMIAHLPVVKC